MARLCRPISTMLDQPRNYAPRDAYVNSLDPHGCTALFYACENGHTDTAQLLLNYGADPHITNPQGVTPLAIARQRNDNQALVQVLEEAGAQY